MSTSSVITSQIVKTGSGVPSNQPVLNQVITASTSSAQLTKHKTEMLEWLQASESALAEGWDNPQDAQYDAV